ncbi:hypothetical protein BF96_05075 [Micrococcus luteus]|nr:hypothetical protein BF96_05075 [Micrococcus luteus]
MPASGGPRGAGRLMTAVTGLPVRFYWGRAARSSGGSPVMAGSTPVPASVVDDAPARGRGAGARQRAVRTAADASPSSSTCTASRPEAQRRSSPTSPVTVTGARSATAPRVTVTGARPGPWRTTGAADLRRNSGAMRRSER